MSAHRGIATVASAVMICFLILSAMEPEFFLLHFYESLTYLAIVLMLFYFEESQRPTKRSLRRYSSSRPALMVGVSPLSFSAVGPPETTKNW
jgi:hypothetical protein